MEIQHNDEKNPMETNQRPPERPGQTMEVVAMVLGVIALATSCCIYASLVCGGLAIILGLLSRGTGKRLNDRARMAVIMGTVAVVSTIVITVAMFAVTISEYGSLQKFMDSYMNTLEQMTDLPTSGDI